MKKQTNHNFVAQYETWGEKRKMENIEIERSELLSGIRVGGLKVFVKRSDGATYVLDKGVETPEALEIRVVDGQLITNRVEFNFADISERKDYAEITSSWSAGGD